LFRRVIGGDILGQKECSSVCKNNSNNKSLLLVFLSRRGYKVSHTLLCVSFHFDRESQLREDWNGNFVVLENGQRLWKCWEQNSNDEKI